MYIKRVQNTITFHRIVSFAYSLYFFNEPFPTVIQELYLLQSKYSFSVTMVNQ